MTIQAGQAPRRNTGAMDFDLYWQAVRWLALEHLHLGTVAGELRADSLIVGSFNGTPLRLRYRLVCDHGWQATRLEVENLAAGERLELERTAHGDWHDQNGRERGELDGATDIDIAATPYTNTLPIRRLRLEPGQSAEIIVAYIAVSPTLALLASRQRYTRLPNEAGRDSYLYESLESDFRRELIVDRHGFVVDYPDIWRRAYPPTP